jgi:acetyl-CoA carboxylase biotin carboxyl carrier protein
MARFTVDEDLIRRLAKLLEETGLGEIEYQILGRRVRIARPAAAPVVSVTEAPARAAEAAPAEAPAISPEHPGAITAPMVGTVYIAPEPGAPPFVRVGDVVKKGQTLLIIEAMKTMNPVTADRDGRVARVLVEDGAPTEYGEVLVILE